MQGGVRLALEQTGEIELVEEHFFSHGVEGEVSLEVGVYELDDLGDGSIGAGAAVQVFLVVDGEGQFTSLSVKADFEATVAAATFDMATGEYIEEGKDISFRCKASAALEAGDVSVDLPGDLDTYPEGGIL